MEPGQGSRTPRGEMPELPLAAGPYSRDNLGISSGRDTGTRPADSNRVIVFNEISPGDSYRCARGARIRTESG